MRHANILAKTFLDIQKSTGLKPYGETEEIQIQISKILNFVLRFDALSLATYRKLLWNIAKKLSAMLLSISLCRNSKRHLRFRRYSRWAQKFTTKQYLITQHFNTENHLIAQLFEISALIHFQPANCT